MYECFEVSLVLFILITGQDARRNDKDELLQFYSNFSFNPQLYFDHSRLREVYIFI